MKVYDGSQWLNAYASLSGALIATSNLSDLNNAGTARTNLGLGTAATTDVSAYATSAQADQTVSLTGAGTTTVSGTYPNFTITGAGTTYTAGTGITLTGTEFSLTDTNAKLNLTGGSLTGTTYIHTGAGSTALVLKSTENWSSGVLNGGGLRWQEADGSSIAGIRGYVDGNGNNNLAIGTGWLDQEVTITSSGMSVAGTITSGGNTVWTSGNDGSGSGLDADTVDGVQASSFLQTSGGTITSGGNIGLKVSHDDFQEGIISYRNHATNSASLVFENASGRTGTLFNQNNFPYWRDGTSTNSHKIWTAGNDGSGSGLDADTVDSVHASSFLRSDASDSFSGTITGNTLYLGGSAITSSIAKLQVNGFQRTGTIYLHEGTSAVAGNNWPLETTSGAELRWNGSKVFHAGNDGSGSGLDADTVDNLQASQFLRSDADDSMSGSLTVTGNVDCNYLRADRIYSNNDGSTGYFFNDSGTRTAYAGGDFYLQTSVPNYYNYATNIYLGNTSGDTVRFRGNVVNHNGFSFDAEGDMSTSRDIVSTSRNRGVFGTYSSYYTDQIWSMGTAYRNSSTGANFGNLYGAAYKHTNNSTGGHMAYGHQFVWCQNGSPKVALGTNIWTSGNVTAYSDIRVKENIEHIPNALDKVCQLNGYTFDRTDVTFDEHGEAETPVRQTGVIAQEVLEVLPEAVIGDEEGHYSVAYGNMVGLLIESIKELKAEVDDLKAQLEAK